MLFLKFEEYVENVTEAKIGLGYILVSFTLNICKIQFDLSRWKRLVRHILSFPKRQSYHLRTFARKFFSIDFFLKFLPL